MQNPCCYHISLLFLQPLKHFLIKQKQKQFPLWSPPPTEDRWIVFRLGKQRLIRAGWETNTDKQPNAGAWIPSGAGKLVYCCRCFGRWPAVICDSYKNLKIAGEFWDLPTRMLPDSKRISPITSKWMYILMFWKNVDNHHLYAHCARARQLFLWFHFGAFVMHRVSCAAHRRFTRRLGLRKQERRRSFPASRPTIWMI